MKLNSRNRWEIEYLPMHDDAVVPKRADEYSIGCDLVVPEDIYIPAHSRFYVPLGFAIGLPKNIEGKIEPRSGFSGKGVVGIGKKWGWKFLFGFLPVYCRHKGNYPLHPAARPARTPLRARHLHGYRQTLRRQGSLRAGILRFFLEIRKSYNFYFYRISIYPP